MKLYHARTIGLAEPVEITAALEQGSGDVAGPASFVGIAYGGGLVPRFTATPKLPFDYVIDLAHTTKSRNNYANLDHEQDQRVGHLTEVENDGKQLAVQGLISAATPYSEQVVQSSRNQSPWEFSGEFNLGKGVLVPKGKKVQINGRMFTGPFIHFQKNQFTDVAFVSHGADGDNEVKVAASAAGENAMDPFQEFMVSCGVDPETASEEQKAKLKKAFDALNTGDGGGQPNSQLNAQLSYTQIAEDERKEHERQQAITKLGQQAMRENPLLINKIEAAGKLAIENRATVAEFELELLRSTRTTTGQFAARSQPEMDPTIIEAAICMNAGLPDLEKQFAAETLHAVEKAGMRYFGLQQLLMQVAHANGYTCRAGERIHKGNIREVLEYCFPPAIARMAGGFSTVSLPGILGNVANKEILSGYMEEDQTWREISRVKPVNNFHAVTSYRMLDDLEYEEVGPTGEIKHGTLSQESYQRQAKTYAKMLGLTREQIINDDLGAFDDIRERLGRGAAKKFQNIFWGRFMNNALFFTTARTNYLEGATTNLGLDGVGLELGLLTYGKMTTPSEDGSKRVGVNLSRPTILLHPPELQFTADRLFTSGNVNTGGAASATSVPDGNIHRGKYRPVTQNRLSDSAFTGFSDKAWYLFGPDLKPMVASFLNGVQTPTVESTDADFNTLGILFRGYHDFGADQSEYLAGVKVKGEA